jgi:hypothetical protein
LGGTPLRGQLRGEGHVWELKKSHEVLRVHPFTFMAYMANPTSVGYKKFTVKNFILSIPI